MSALASNPDLADRQNRVGYSAVDQVSDDYVAKRTDGNVVLALDSETPLQHAPAHFSSFEQSPNRTVGKEVSYTFQQISAQAVVPKVGDHSLDQVQARQKRRLMPVTEWEGYIESIDEEEFSLRMVNVRSKSALPVDQATFSKDEVSEYDRSLLREGAIVRWVIGRERLPTGQIRNVSELYFRRLPANSEMDYRRAYKKAGDLLDLIVWENEAESQ